MSLIPINVTTMAETILERLQAYEDDHALLRQFVIPEEDRHLFTSVKWAGEYRWFKSPNVVCLEKAKLVRDQQTKQAA